MDSKKKLVSAAIVATCLIFIAVISSAFSPVASAEQGKDKREGEVVTGVPEMLSDTLFSVKETTSSLEFTVVVGDYRKLDDRIEFKGDIPATLAGLPIVPSLVKEFVIPDDMAIVGAELVDDTAITIDFVPEVHIPVRKNIFGLNTSEKIGLSPEEVQPIQLTSIYPSRPFNVLEGEPLKNYNYKLCNLVLYPAQYDPATNKTIIHEKLKIKVNLAPGEQEVTREDPPFITRAEQLYGSIDPSIWIKGRRAMKNDDFDSVYVKGEVLGCMAIPLCIRWDENQNPEYIYGIVISPETKTKASKNGESPETKTISKSEADAILRISNYSKVNEVTDKERMTDLIVKEWDASQGIVVSSPEMSHSTCAIASYLDWPLYIMDSNADQDKVRNITEMLATNMIIAAGCKPSFDGEMIEVNTEEQANALLYIIHEQTNFFETVGHPEDAITKKVLNPPTSPKQTGAKYVYYMIVHSSFADISQSSVNILKAYRSATYVDVDMITPAKRIVENYVSSYDPLYLALIGDGDYWECDQFFAPDTIAEASDPAYIPTDFFYEERTMVSYSDSDYDGRIESVSWPGAGSGTYTWSPDSKVGRIMCYDDASFQTYVQMIDDYEHGRLSTEQYRWLAFFSYFCESWAATWDVHDTLVNCFLATWHPIYCDGCSQGCDYSFTASNTYWEFGWGNHIHYFNTHGAHDCLTVSRTGDDLRTSGVSSHPLGRPGFMWVDSCLTASLGNEVNSGYIMTFPDCDGTWVYPDDNTCFGTRWLSNGALGYMGSSMIAYGGDFDAFDKALANEMYGYPSQSLANSIGWAKSRYYAAVGGGDAYTKKTVLEINYFGDPKVVLPVEHWDGWEHVGYGSTSASPALTSTSDGSVHLSIRGTDNGVYYNRRDPSTGWTGWERVQGGSLYNSPALTSTSDGSVHLSIRGTDNGVYYNRRDPSTGWDGWERVQGGSLYNSPALTSTSDGSVHLSIRGTDNGVYYNRRNPTTGWTGWERVQGGSTSDSPALTSTSDGSVHLSIRGTDNGVYYNRRDPSTGWDGWERVQGGSLYNSPALTSTSDGSVHLSIRGTDNGVYYNRRNPTTGWGGWEHVQWGSTSDSPALTSTSDGSVHLSIRGTDNGVYYNRRNPTTGWGGWEHVQGGSLYNSPALTSTSDGSVHLSIRGTDNGVYYNRRVP